MRSFRRIAASAAIAALALSACGGDGDATGDPTDGGTAVDGPTVTVGSFNFSESVILAELYAQVLEDAGITVERNLNVGSRELIYPELESGDIDLLPEYLGSALVVGFGEEAVPDTAGAAEALQAAFEEQGVTVLEPSEAEDKNVFVVTQDYSDENAVTSLGDLAGLGATLGGPPECEDRETCYQGVVDAYGLDDLQFSSIQEAAARLAALDSGDIQVTLLFSTQPIIEQAGYVVLEDPETLIPAENITPVVRDEVIEAYGDTVIDALNAVSAALTTANLTELIGRVDQDGEDPAAVATSFLEDNGLIG